MDKNVISVKTVEEKTGKFSECTSVRWWSLSDTYFSKGVCVCVYSLLLLKQVYFCIWSVRKEYPALRAAEGLLSMLLSLSQLITDDSSNS